MSIGSCLCLQIDIATERPLVDVGNLLMLVARPFDVTRRESAFSQRKRGAFTSDNVKVVE